MWIHLLPLGLVDGAGGAVAPEPDRPAVGDGHALTWSQHKKLLERLRRKRRRLEAEEVELVESAYESLPEPVQASIAEQAKPVLQLDDGVRRRIDARMSERKRAAVAAIVEAYLRHQQQEDDELIVSMI